MYVLKPGIKRDPVRRWALPDRVFFGHGACHILAGAYLLVLPLPGFRPEFIQPAPGFAGTHIYVTDGTIAFDYHGYSSRTRLLAHHAKGWRARLPGWEARITPVAFDLLSTPALNARKMLGRDQYLHDPLPRAERFLGRIDHVRGSEKARSVPE